MREKTAIRYSKSLTDGVRLMLLNLRIGRNNYQITEKDKFLDNGACVQLMTQSKEKWDGVHRPNPKLSRRELQEISKFQKIYLTHHYGENFKLFSLR